MLKLLITKFGLGIVAVGMFVSAIFGGQQVANFGAAIPTTISVFETSLASAIGTSDTSMTMAIGTDRAGNVLSGLYCFTLDAGTSIQEFVCGTVSGTAVTSMTRGIDPQNPNTSVTALQFAHRRGADIKVTDYPQLAIISRILNGTDTVPNILTYASTPSFSTANQIITKGYADALTFAGAPNSNTTTKGILQEATTSDINSGTQAGSTGAELAVNPFYLSSSIYNSQLPTSGQKSALVGNNTDIAVGSGNTFITQTGLQHGAENYAADSSISANTITAALSPVPTSYTNGMAVKVKVANAVTGATTINLNALGAKSVKKYTAGVQSALIANDILAGQTVTLVYDGTNFILQGTGANAITSATPAFVKWATGVNPGSTSGTSWGGGQYATSPTGYSSTKFGYLSSQQGNSSTGHRFYRFAYDVSTGVRTLIGVHNPTALQSIATNSNGPGVAVLGSNVYVSIYDTGNTVFKLYRYDTAMGTETAMTMAGGTYPGNGAVPEFSNDTNLYIYSGSSDNYYIYTISGTTATYSSTVSYTGISNNRPTSDGTSVWAIVNGVPTKWAIAGGAATATGNNIGSGAGGDVLNGIGLIGSYLDVAWFDSINGLLLTNPPAQVPNYISLAPISKP